MRRITLTEWWIMDCSFPDLNWARLRVYDDGTSEVFDCDGRTHQFVTQKDANNWLCEDEFRTFLNLEPEDLEDCPFELGSFAPPEDRRDEELLRFMYQEWVPSRSTWVPKIPLSRP